MSVIVNILWSILVFTFVVRLLNVFLVMMRYNKKSDIKSDEVKMENNKQDLLKKEITMEEAVEMVQDEISKVFVPKQRAYQFVQDDRVYYFTSWENRQCFIEQWKSGSL